MATTYHDPDGRVAAYVLQGRTDGSGVEAEGEHVDGQDLRLLSQFLTAGVKGAAAFQVRERQAGAAMSVDVGSGTVGDVAVIAGADPLQGNYIVGWPEAVTNVAIGAADLLNPRIDEIYLVVQDDTYDHNGANIVPRLAVRDGTPSPSPTPPGPDASWKAYLLLATVDVAAGTTEIEAGDITDERVFAAIGVDVVDVSAVEVDEASEVSASALSPDTTTTVITVSLPIPASWNSWKCVAYATMVGRATGESVGRVTVWTRIDGADQPTQNNDLSLSRTSIAVGGRRTGITTTGTRSVSVQANSAVPAQLSHIFLYARAVRTS